MNIAIDGNLMCGKKTGMGTVVYQVLQYWKSEGGHTIILYVPEGLDRDYMKILDKNGIRVKILGKTNYFRWEQIVIPKAIKRDSIDVLWCPYNTAPLKISCKTIVTVNDVIYMDVSLNSAPSLYKKMGIIYRKSIVPFAVRNAKRIITISEYAKKEIVRFFPKQEKKTVVIYLNADIGNEALEDTDKERFFSESGISGSYILGFGSLETRKNSLRLIKAYENLPMPIRQKYQLVLFGFRGFKESEDYRYICEKQLDSNIIVLGYVSDKEKATLYNNSKVFVFPTLSEGFGIPVLEAFSAMTPVITSNVTSIPEIAGEAALLVNPKKICEITGAIQQVLMDDSLAATMVAAGVAQLNKFDWKITADKILKEILSL